MSWSSSSSKSSGKNGENWTNQVYFDPNADLTGRLLEEITAANLLYEMGLWIEGEELIEEIWVYKCPLAEWQLTMALFNHQFVVFRTPWWWWSIEKNDQGITVQRGKKLSSVRDRYRRGPRKKYIEQMSRDVGRRKMKDLVDWLHQKNESHKKYHYLTENCKDFAKRVFDEFAKSKVHYT